MKYKLDEMSEIQKLIHSVFLKLWYFYLKYIGLGFHKKKWAQPLFRLNDWTIGKISIIDLLNHDNTNT